MVRSSVRQFCLGVSVAGVGLGVLLLSGRVREQPVVFTVWEAEAARYVPEGLKVQPGQPCPDFGLATTGGDTVRPSGLRGRRVAVVLLTRGCRYCVELSRDLGDLRQEGKGGELLVVSVGDTADAREVQRELLGGIDVCVDPDGLIMAEFGVSGTPAVLIIGADGRLERVGYGLPGSRRAVKSHGV